MTQLRTFCLLLLLGFVLGSLYEPIRIVGRGRRGRALRFMLDLLFCLAAGAAYLCLSVSCALPGFRLFHAAGLGAGLLLYEKSLHKTVAFFARKVYNIAKASIQKQKDKPLCKTRDSRSRKKKPRGSP